MSELILSNFALHIALAPEEKEQVLALLQIKKVTKRSILLRPGEIERHIYFINKGCLRMYHTDKDGQEHNLCFYPENWWACDIVSFFKAKRATNSIQALEDTEVCYFSLPALERLFNELPRFERFFRILTQNGFDMFQRRVTSNLSKTAEQRYREFHRHYPGLEQRISQKHIASYLGITAAFLSMMRKERDL
ncbi:Crp/Fnr family transcriptional regulator [Mucilaginibacter myungsuensis]|uniref:Crp/Fnr family transcriptional regulator n=1 Tax=Mucilaginibacter myungsuensis TaxID=649104 RepID=A0A929KZ06_9SPHI|nr:Crp/Fnr family transcriptional regulator [Mucilaginibacter myungsuensis]MBE9663145.1 Crp/Fnr family transcriptional regulator [Mucilaginibacter myungsuensis]MDN3598780.1 Crp/Fnr family transcriptional regulator [Mucilaginibacter myungsuensis]